MIPLALVDDGEKIEIIDFIKKYKASFYQLRDMGLVSGKVAEVLKNHKQGPILLKVDESRLAIGRGIAMKIMVRRLG